jgi:hypothetical protein
VDEDSRGVLRFLGVVIIIGLGVLPLLFSLIPPSLIRDNVEALACWTLTIGIIVAAVLMVFMIIVKKEPSNP